MVWGAILGGEQAAGDKLHPYTSLEEPTAASSHIHPISPPFPQAKGGCMSQTSAAENASGTFTSGKTQPVSRGLQYVTATITCGSNGLVPGPCVVFLRVKHARATAAQPHPCFQGRRSSASASLGSPFRFHLYVRAMDTLCSPSLLVTAAVC